jgi:WD40 repeat protein
MSAGSTDSLIRVWNTITWELEHTLEGYIHTVERMVMCKDMLLSGAQDSTIRAWS